MSKSIKAVLEHAVQLARKNNEGAVAAYIPELASMPEEYTAIAVRLPDGTFVQAGDNDKQSFTLQSAAKLVVLTGMIEEFGLEQVLAWVKVEPSGDDFASIARLDQFGPRPSNPMLNSGAITLCSHIPGNQENKLSWLEGWFEILFGENLVLNPKVFASEKRTGDRNRALAYLLQSNNMLASEVDDTLETYFYLCSFEATMEQSAHLPMLLANLGKNTAGKQVIQANTARNVLAVMSTCGLYNESGNHMVRTGLPAKSSVSGFILASSPGNAGISTMSPRVNRKGTSTRGELMLEYVSKEMGWHFAG